VDEFCRLDGFAVSVFYLRAGYTPDDYPSDAEWDARRLMERCNAVSCPSVAYQLVGAKKTQQDLAVPGMHPVACCDVTLSLLGHQQTQLLFWLEFCKNLLHNCCIGCVSACWMKRLVP
jgi:hypothetical protein